MLRLKPFEVTEDTILTTSIFGEDSLDMNSVALKHWDDIIFATMAKKKTLFVLSDTANTGITRHGLPCNQLTFDTREFLEKNGILRADTFFASKREGMKVPVDYEDVLNEPKLLP